MHEVKKKNVKKSIILRIGIIMFAIYIVVALIDQQVKINSKEAELESLKKQIVIQEITNENLKASLESGGYDYIEQIAREELDYAKPGERIFINIAGE